MDPFATHLPVTKRALIETAKIFPDLPVMECGCGDYSSPLFHKLKGKRRYEIYSSDPTWSGKYADVADQIIDVEQIGTHKWGDWGLANPPYGMCLLDSEEFVKNRVRHVSMLLENCRVVVMHDASASMLGLARFDHLHRKISPYTWIGSNIVDVREWFDD